MRVPGDPKKVATFGSLPNQKEQFNLNFEYIFDKYFWRYQGSKLK